MSEDKIFFPLRDSDDGIQTHGIGVYEEDEIVKK